MIHPLGSMKVNTEFLKIDRKLDIQISCSGLKYWTTHNIKYNSKGKIQEERSITKLWVACSAIKRQKLNRASKNVLATIGWVVMEYLWSPEDESYDFGDPVTFPRMAVDSLSCYSFTI